METSDTLRIIAGQFGQVQIIANSEVILQNFSPYPNPTAKGNKWNLSSILDSQSEAPKVENDH